MKLAFYVVADRVTHNAILVAQVQTWMASGGKCYWTVTVWWCCCCSSETGPSSTEWALGAYCFDFALFISLKTRGYPTANRYNRDPYQQKCAFWLYWSRCCGEEAMGKKDVEWPGTQNIINLRPTGYKEVSGLQNALAMQVFQFLPPSKVRHNAPFLEWSKTQGRKRSRWYLVFPQSNSTSAILKFPRSLEA